MKESKSLKGTWPQALLSFFTPLLIILVIRWAVVEPYVIPSGSMIPHLLVNDHVFVKKFSFGLRMPFSDRWMFRWEEPKPGEIIVFRFPENPQIFYIKRLVGTPGDQIRIDSGRISVNGKAWDLKPTAAPVGAPGNPEAFEYFIESSGNEQHTVRFMAPISDEENVREWTVPEGSYFFVGDNRDQSSDSRVWGFVPEKNLMGKAWSIWLSCDQMLESAKFLCDPASIRWNRLFHNVDGSASL